MAMRSLLLTVVLLIAALQTAQAVDITLCDMVANDQAAVVPLKAQLDDGREVHSVEF